MPLSDELAWKSAAEIALLIRTRQLSPVEVVDAVLERIERRNPSLNALVYIAADEARKAAREAEKAVGGGDPLGPLHGVPSAIKDLFDFKPGWPATFGGIPSMAKTVIDAYCGYSERIEKVGGAILIGKTNSPIMGFRGACDNPLFGPTSTPFAIGRNSGGSSGGSAAAVGDGLLPFAEGTDGGGSIRIPSALCGLSGLKPSQGRVPNGGERAPGSVTLSTRGPMARTIRDVALALDACVGPDPTDIFSFPGLHDPWHPQLTGEVEPPPRVAYSPTMGHYRVDSEVAAAVRRTVDALADAGTEIVEVDVALDEEPTRAWFVLWCAARARAQGHLLGTPGWDLIDEGLQPLIEYGLRLTAVDVVRAFDACHDANLQLEANVFSKAPILLTPTLAGQAPLSGQQGTIDGVEEPSWVGFTPFANLTRSPAGSVTCGFTSSGLPIGLQVVGAQRDDLGVLRTIAAVEDLVGMDAIAPI